MAKKERRCDSCYFTGQCLVQGYCDDYVPMREEVDEEKLIRHAVGSRKEYYKAWIEYTKDFN